MHDIVLFIEAHLGLSCAVIAIVIALMMIELIKAKQNAAKVSPQQAIQLMNHQNAAIIDIRNKETFVNGHILNAMSIPLTELSQQGNKLDKMKTQPIIIVCASGSESQHAAALLIKQGFNHVTILANGIRAWRDAGLPLIKG